MYFILIYTILSEWLTLFIPNSDRLNLARAAETHLLNGRHKHQQWAIRKTSYHVLKKHSLCRERNAKGMWSSHAMLTPLQGLWKLRDFIEPQLVGSILNPNAKEENINRLFFCQKAVQEEYILPDSQPSLTQAQIPLSMHTLNSLHLR